MTPATRRIVGCPAARFDAKVPVCAMPRLSSAAIVPAMPAVPWSSEWFEAVLHASQPLLRIDRARSAGVLKIG